MRDPTSQHSEAIFFNPSSYLHGDPGEARSKREADLLQRQAHQRAMFCRCMVQVAAGRGYESASVKKAARLSGLGRGTFYGLFEDSEACLLEAFERCAEEIFARVEAAGRGGGTDFRERLKTGLDEMLELLADQPEVARFVLVEIRVGGTACREAQQRWLERFAGLLVDSGGRGAAPTGEGLACMAAGAMTSLLALKVIEKGPDALTEILEELAYVGLLPRYGAAVEASKSFAIATRAPNNSAPKAVRKKRAAAVGRPFKMRAQRLLLLGTMARLVGAKGYEATRVTDVSKRAGLSEYVFYTHFTSKEECLLAAFDVSMGTILKRIGEAMASEAAATGRAEAGLQALVGSLAEQPAVARLVTIETRRAGASGEERYAQALASFAQLFDEASGDRGDGDVARLVAATVAGMIAREVGEGRARQLKALLPELVFTVLAPCLGGERAAARARAVSEPQPR